jgi:hypothetical protein
MSNIFEGATAFSQNISNWIPVSGCDFSGIFTNATGMEKYSYLGEFPT